MKGFALVPRLFFFLSFCHAMILSVFGCGSRHCVSAANPAPCSSSPWPRSRGSRSPWSRSLNSLSALFALALHGKTSSSFCAARPNNHPNSVPGELKRGFIIPDAENRRTKVRPGDRKRSQVRLTKKLKSNGGHENNERYF